MELFNVTENPLRIAERASRPFPTPADALDPDYYLHNMFLVLDFVLERDPHLFSADETSLLERFGRSPEGARRLFARLYGRRGPFFQLSKLTYREIPDISSAADTLLTLGLARHPRADDLDHLLALFTVKDLKAIAKAQGLRTPGSLRRGALLELLKSAQGPDFDLVATLLPLGPFLALKEKALFDRVFRLFFLNEWLGPGTLVALDLAHIAFPRYEVRRSRPVFETREQLADYETALDELAQLNALEELEDNDPLLAFSVLLKSKIDAAPPPPEGEHPYLRRFTASALRCKALYRLGRALERRKSYQESADTFAYLLGTPWLPHRRARYWERLSVDRQHLKDKPGSLAACEAALEDAHLGAGQRGDLEARARRLRKQLGLESVSPPRAKSWERLDLSAPILSQGPRQRTLFQSLDGEEVIVERLALSHFEAQGWRGTWAENGLYTTLFGRLLWDVIFAPVNDVFQTPFQDRPLDLGTAAFFPTREAALRARFAAIEEGEFEGLLEASSAFQGQACRGVAWGIWPDELLLEAAKALGGRALRFILEALAKDYHRLSRGMPDLLLWRGDGEAMMVEVKSPRDRLSKEQKAWLTRLVGGGIRAAVLRVENGPHSASP